MLGLVSNLAHTWRTAICLAFVVAIFLVAAATADAGGSFCYGNHAANSSCEGPHDELEGAQNHSNNGGWSWVWAWNEISGGYAESCRSGNCKVTVQLSVETHGKEQMANISGNTYFYLPVYY